MDLDVALERPFRVFQTQIALAAAEQRHEDVPEVLAHLDECLKEELASGRVDLADRLLKRALCRVEVVALRGEKAEALRFFLVLLDRERVDGTESVQLLADQRRLGAKRFVIQLQRFRSGEQFIDRLFPLCFQSLANRRAAARELGVTELRRVQLFAQCR